MSLEYNNKQIDGRMRISPSSMFTYFDNPYKFYKSNILGEKQPPNASMIIGTIIHFRIELMFQGKEPDTKAEAEYIIKFENLPLDEWKILETVDKTWNQIIENKLYDKLSKPENQEQWVEYIPRTNDKVWLSGTYDAFYGDTIVDYKTCSTIPTEIKTTHRIQTYLYAFILRQQGIEVNNIEISYIQLWDKGKKNERFDGTKKYKEYLGSKDANIITYKEPIDEDFMETVLDQIKKLGQIIEICEKDKSMYELFFRVNLLSHF